MILALIIFAATLVLVIWQPRGLGIGYSASGGALAALAVGVVSLSDVPEVFGIIWNATLAFIAVIIISLLLDEAGFFEWAALHVARWGRGDGRLLFALIVALGAAIAALFANDGAALILTPIVVAMLLELGFGAAATLAFVMATGFIADTASLPFVVSNLVNIVSADFFGLGFSEYARVMVPVNLVSVAASLTVLYFFFRRDLPARRRRSGCGDDARPAPGGVGRYGGHAGRRRRGDRPRVGRSGTAAAHQGRHAPGHCGGAASHVHAARRSRLAQGASQCHHGDDGVPAVPCRRPRAVGGGAQRHDRRRGAHSADARH